MLFITDKKEYIMFWIILGFTIIDKQVIKDNVELLNNLSKERIFDELYKMAYIKEQ
jgi:tRNA nucleotidyltransferase/poly(A) polymerase